MGESLGGSCGWVLLYFRRRDFCRQKDDAPRLIWESRRRFPEALSMPQHSHDPQADTADDGEELREVEPMHVTRFKKNGG